MKHLATSNIQIRARDIDMFNHVNNSVYLTYMEEARWKWFDDAGLREKYKNGLAIVEAHLQFKRPINFPGEVIVESFCSKVGVTSFTVHHTLAMASEPKKICCTAEIKIVFFDLKSLKPIPMPDCFKELM